MSKFKTMLAKGKARF